MPLFSIPLSGLTASSTAMSAIANNLANLNTVGYKGSSTEFNDLFYQTLGVNGSDDPIQVGAGTGVSATSSNMNSGSVEATSVPTDVAIMGDGFFVVQQNGASLYTRAGNFSVAADGALQTPNGEQVLGYAAINGTIPAGAALAPLEINQAATNLTNAETARNAALQAAASIGNLSLFNYLSSSTGGL